jgi:hypothetical protein
MAERRKRPGLAALLALSVALGAILASEPFDAWTSVSIDQNAPPAGEHALLPRAAPAFSARAHLRASQRLLVVLFAVALAITADVRRQQAIDEPRLARRARWLGLCSPDRGPPVLVQ